MSFVEAPTSDFGWLGVELRHLAALRAIARTGSFRRAADRLGFTQPAISHQIATLERRVGAQLVHRPRGGAGRVTLTPAGELLLAHGEAMLERLDQARRDLALLVAAAPETVRIGVATPLGARLLAPAVAELRAVEPDAAVTLVSLADPAALVQELVRGQFDLGIVAGALHDAAVIGQVLVEEPYVLLGPASAATDAVAEVGPAELAALPLIASADEATATLERSLARRNLAPNVVARCDDVATALALVGAGAGYALVPLSLAEECAASCAVIATRLELPTRRVCLVHHRNRPPSPAARALARLLAR